MERNAQHGLARRILMLLMLLSVLFALAAYLGYHQLLRLQLAPLETHQNDKVNQLLSTLNRELGDIRNLMRLLHNAPDVQSQLSAAGTLDQAQLTQALSRFGSVNSWISQVRWLDAQGEEKARINISGASVLPVPPMELQNKADRYYVQAGMQQPAGTVFISRLDLNIEHHRIVHPLEPTLRATIRTGLNDGLRPGLLVINFNLAQLFTQFRRLNDADSDVQIVDDAGYWRLHPDPHQEWGQELGHNQLTLAREFPQAWRYMQQHPNDFNSRVINGRLWSYWRFEEAGSRPGAPDTLYLISATRPDVIASIARQLFWTVLTVSLLLYGLTATLLIRLYLTDAHRSHLAAQLAREKRALEASYNELQQAHSNLQLLQDELVETRKLSSLGVMVAGVAHELNTPTGSALMSLSALQRATEQLTQQIESGLTRSALTDYVAQTRKGLELATHSLRRAAELIKSFKRVAVERSTDNLQEFSLGLLIDDLLLSLHHKLKHTRVEIETEIDPEIRLYGYPGILSQLLQNLIENALTHAFDPGQPGSIQLASRLVESGNQLELAIRDNGSGILPALRENLFDPFVTSKRADGHTGLGMHLVHQWATQVLDGHIRVDSEAGKGSRFTVTIPIRLPAAEVPDNR